MFNNYFWTGMLIAISPIFDMSGQSGSLMGKIQTSQKEVLPHIDILLRSLPDSNQIASSLTDVTGTYVFEKLKAGHYLVSAFNVKFNESRSLQVILDDNETKVVNFTFDFMITKVEDVVISSQKSLIKQESDKMVVNVENTLSNSGLTSVDVLRKMPGIFVDKDGKISLKGRSGVMVMLDDKALYMTEDQLGSLLKSLPSDLIKEIEIISSPSAKYDAVGNAGIINIRLKQGAYEGFNGAYNASFGYGRYHKANTGLNLSFKKKKFSIDGGYQYNNKEGLAQYYGYRTYTDPNTELNTFKSDSYFRLPETSHSVFLKSQYNINPKSSLSLNLNTFIGNFGWDGGSISNWITKDQNIQSSFESHDKGISKYQNLNIGLDYKYNFDTLGTKLVIGTSINQNHSSIDKNFIIQYYDSAYQVQNNTFLLKQKNNTASTQYSGKVDFTKIVFKKVKLETGVKANYLNDFRPIDIQIRENNADRDASNHFLYKEGIYSAYILGNAKLHKWNFQAGLRTENSQISGTQTIKDTTFKRSYTNFFPSGNVSYSPNSHTTYSLQYSKRIRRPSGQDLNPILNIVDPYTSWGGYPYLLPEYTDNVEFAYSILNGYLISTINYSHTKQPIIWVSQVDAKTLATVSGNRNLIQSSNLGLALTTNFPITKWWNTNNYAYVYKNSIEGDMGYGIMTNGGASWMFNSTQSFKLPKQTSIEVSGNYEAPKAYALGKGLAFGQFNIALQKKFLKDKASLKIAYSDIFWTMYYRGTFQYDNIMNKNGYRWDNSTWMVTFNYKFGKRLER